MGGERLVGRTQDIRQTILDHALDLCSEIGLEGLSFGALAKRVGMSKSGLYAHFDTKESLQSDVLDHAAARFIDSVAAPALKKPRGLPRMRDLYSRWLAWEGDEFTGGCPFFTASSEFDDRPGQVRNSLQRHLKDMLEMVSRVAETCIEERHFVSDLDTRQFAFEFYGALLSYHQFRRLMDSARADDMAREAFESLLYRSQA